MRSSFRVDQQAATGATSLLARALRLRPAEWVDLVVATLELAIARSRLATSHQSVLLADRGAVPRPDQVREAADRVQRVRVAIARASRRVPWRSDCLVQALAAQRWLRRTGVETALCVGVSGETASQFEAHAWLMHGDDVITGGEVGGFAPLSHPTHKAGRRQSSTD
jgi:hypothetical protein